LEELEVVGKVGEVGNVGRVGGCWSYSFFVLPEGHPERGVERI
jgi:hypothetical protein